MMVLGTRNAVAGLIGLPEVLGDAHKYDLGFARGLGFTGIAVALVGRNHPGGMAPRLSPMIECLAACGWSRIVIETVGAGQSEIRIVAFTDRVLLVDGPDRGDIVQAEKAGIMELADVIAINK